MERLKEDVYITPEISIVNLSCSDVITTSRNIEDSLPDDTWQS